MNQHIGKTVKSIELHGIKGFDDKPILILKFTDDSELLLRATYGGYTGNSEDEYPSFIVEGLSNYSEAKPYLIEQFTGE